MSQPTSPVIPPTSAPLPHSDPDSALERAPRSFNKLSLSGFRRPSSAPSSSPNHITTTLVQDGSYLEMWNLKLSEAISKALSQPTGPATAHEQLFGKRPIPQGRGRALSALITAEFKATQDSLHLHKAIIRSLQPPLSVLLTNLSTHLLPLISSPAFQSPPAPTLQNPNPNPTQIHALSIATFADELLETFDALDLGTDVDVRGDSLKSIREGFVSLINRVVGPLIAGIRQELMPLLEALEIPNTVNGLKAPIGVKISTLYHPSIVTLQGNMPVYAKALARYTTSTTSHTTLATFVISVVWRGLVALSHRPSGPPSPPVSPGLPVTGRFAIKLPPSHPLSPPGQVVLASTADDARALFDLLRLLPRPTGNREITRLAREVIDDAFEGLKALSPLFDAVFSITSSKVNSQYHLNELASELELLATEVPLLIALPILLQIPLHGRCIPITVSGLIGFSKSEYRKECLSGFGRAEECATTVALRVLGALRMNPDVHPIVCKWLEMEIAEAL